MNDEPSMQQLRNLINEDKLQDALKLISILLSQSPQAAKLHFLQGIVYEKQNASDLALSSFRTACYLGPGLTLAWFKQVGILAKLGYLESALSEIKRSLQIVPNDIERQKYLGIILLKMEQWEQAQIVFEDVISKRDGKCDDDFLKLGLSFLGQDCYSQASVSFQEAISICPDNLNALCNLGITFKDSHNLTSALKCFQLLEQKNSEYLGLHGNYAITLFLLGNYDLAWKEYAWRLFETPQIVDTPSLPLFTESMGKVNCLLIVCEQGLGDTFQFIRYIDKVSEFAEKIKVVIQASIVPLARHSFPSIDIVDSSFCPNNSDQIDAWIPLISCAQMLKVASDCVVTDRPYLSIKNTLVSKWKKKLGVKSKRRLAVCWQGNPEAEKGHQRNRSMSLMSLDPLFCRNDFEIISLQRGYGSEQIDSLGWRSRFHPIQDEIDDIWDFEEVGAILSNCDALISVDTSITHLAGAIGLPSILLLKWTPDWRWGIHGDSTFWYPSHRLFRQNQNESWVNTVQRMVDIII